MKNRIPSVNKDKKNKYSIEEMDTLLDQIADFKKLLNMPHDASDPEFKQEYRLFKQYIEWISEDLVNESYITVPNIHTKH